jgi:hypothetical protein
MWLSRAEDLWTAAGTPGWTLRRPTAEAALCEECNCILQAHSSTTGLVLVRGKKSPSHTSKEYAASGLQTHNTLLPVVHTSFWLDARHVTGC